MKVSDVVFTGAEVKEIIHSVDTVPVLKEMWWKAVLHYTRHKKGLCVDAHEELYETCDSHPQLFI